MRPKKVGADTCESEKCTTISAHGALLTTVGSDPCSPEALSDMIKNGCKDPFPLDVMQALGGSVGVAKALGTSLKKVNE